MLYRHLKRAHLKFSVYGRKQTNRQTDLHTHVRNAVTLVWGSLRLAPIKFTPEYFVIVEPLISLFPLHTLERALTPFLVNL